MNEQAYKTITLIEFSSIFSLTSKTVFNINNGNNFKDSSMYRLGLISIIGAIYN